MKTITVNTPQPTTENKPARDFYQARSAVVVGGFLFTGFVGVGFLSLYALPPFVRWPLALVPFGLFLAFTVAALLGIIWVSWDVAGGWVLEFVAWWKRPNETPQEVPPLAIPQELNSGERIAYAARLVLELHFIEQVKTTRAECEAHGISQPLWNTVNKIYNAVGIKSGNDWKMDYLNAIRAIKTVQIEENGSVWVPNGNGMKRL